MLERAGVAVIAETDEVEAAVAGVLLDDVAVRDAVACGAASAVAAKSRIEWLVSS